MSKLKATTAQEIVQNEKDCDYMDELFGGVKMPPTQVYLKSEADKYIAELLKGERKLRRKLWLARATAARNAAGEIHNLIACIRERRPNMSLDNTEAR